MRRLESSQHSTRENRVRRIFSKENVLSPREREFLISFYDPNVGLASGRDYNSRPVIHYYDLLDVDGTKAKRLLKIAIRCKKEIETYFETGELFLESLFIACLWPGDLHMPHADNERKERGKWVPNHTSQRDYSALIYLNDTFTGGQLVFPGLRLVVVPKPGLLVAFPSNHDFIHKVRKVRSGRRYSVPIWFTSNSKEAMRV
jgi:predicted 2-oxoglutarate/Fe(II)-dependent dioxygenase YbiX